MGLLLLLDERKIAPPPPVRTYATWNPADRFNAVSNIPTLSNGNLTVSLGGGWYAVRATIGKTSGSWFYQIKVDVTNYVMIGVATASSGLSYAGNGNPYSWGISTNGYNNYPGGYASNGVGFNAGDIMGCSILRGSNTAKFYKYNSGTSSWNLVYTADTSAAGAAAIYPYCSVLDGTGTANFGASAFAAAVPDGANEGVYS